jgi:hypothetical protein
MPSTVLFVFSYLTTVYKIYTFFTVGELGQSW